jgi:hypothetical protein
MNYSRVLFKKREFESFNSDERIPVTLLHTLLTVSFAHFYLVFFKKMPAAKKYQVIVKELIR